MAVYRLAIQRVFLVAIAFSGVAWLLSFLEKDILLRVNLVTEYGLRENERSRISTTRESERSHVALC